MMKQILPYGVRNKTFDAIATLLMQGRSVERCLVWVLALVRGKLSCDLAQHTQRAITDSLRLISGERSRRGLLASLLMSEVNKACAAQAMLYSQ